MRSFSTFVRRLRYPIEGEHRFVSPSVLIVTFHGKIRDGGSGNPQGDYMTKYLRDVMTGRILDALIIDLQDVSYTFGNSVWNIWMWLNDMDELLTIVVTSPKSAGLEPAISRLAPRLKLVQSVDAALVQLTGDARDGE